MNSNNYQKDLFVLTADKNMEFSLKGILERHKSLKIKKIKFFIGRYQGKDPGCLCEGVNAIKDYSKLFHHGLILFDRDGCGRDGANRNEIEEELEKKLKLTAWGDRASVIVIEPELENWLWSDSPHVDEALGWKGKIPSVREWLKKENFIFNDLNKPIHPKEAVEAALEKVNKNRSSSIYEKIAQKVSFERCQDDAFLKLKRKLLEWFPIN